MSVSRASFVIVRALFYVFENILSWRGPEAPPTRPPTSGALDTEDFFLPFGLSIQHCTLLTETLGLLQLEPDPTLCGKSAPSWAEGGVAFQARMAKPLQWEGSESRSAWGPGAWGADERLVLDLAFLWFPLQGCTSNSDPSNAAGLPTGVAFLNPLHWGVPGQRRGSVRWMEVFFPFNFIWKELFCYESINVCSL